MTLVMTFGVGVQIWLAVKWPISRPS